MDAQAISPDTTDCLALAMLFRRTARLLSRAHHSRDHAHHAQEHVMALVGQHGSINQSDMQEMLDVRSSSLSELLAKLEKAGRIVRERNPRDRRGFVISAAAENAVGKAHETGGFDGAMRESAETLFGVLDEAERRQLWNLLQKLGAPLKDMEESFHEHGPGFHYHGHHGHHGRRGRDDRKRQHPHGDEE